MDDKVKYGEITVQWLTIKDLLAENKLEEAYTQINIMIGKLGYLTLRGFTKIDGIDMDLWKTRVWVDALEKYFCLPEIDEKIEADEIFF